MLLRSSLDADAPHCARTRRRRKRQLGMPRDADPTMFFLRQKPGYCCAIARRHICSKYLQCPRVLQWSKVQQSGVGRGFDTSCHPNFFHSRNERMISTLNAGSGGVKSIDLYQWSSVVKYIKTESFQSFIMTKCCGNIHHKVSESTPIKMQNLKQKSVTGSLPVFRHTYMHLYWTRSHTYTGTNHTIDNLVIEQIINKNYFEYIQGQEAYKKKKVVLLKTKVYTLVSIHVSTWFFYPGRRTSTSRICVTKGSLT